MIKTHTGKRFADPLQDSVLLSEAESIEDQQKSRLASTLSNNFGNQVLYTNGYKRQ